MSSASTDFPDRNAGSVPAPDDERAPLWLLRAALVVRVMLFIEFGLVLLVLPWSVVWTTNNLLAAHPDLKAFMASGFIRGLISGIGLVDIWFGIWEAVHYRERR